MNRLCKTQKRGMENGFIHKIEKKDSIGYSQGQASENMRKMEGRCEKKEVIPWLSINLSTSYPHVGDKWIPACGQCGWNIRSREKITCENCFQDTDKFFCVHRKKGVFHIEDRRFMIKRIFSDGKRNQVILRGKKQQMRGV